MSTFSLPSESFRFYQHTSGKRLPEKDVQFIIISQIQNKDGWAKHPLDEQLRANSKNQFISDV